MLDELRDRMISYLSQNRVCVIATNGSQGAWAVAAQYDNSGLELNCLLPRWSDVFFHIQQEPRIMVIIQDVNPLRWLQIYGIAHIANSIDERYVPIHVLPERIDLIDETRGWGMRETFEL